MTTTGIQENIPANQGGFALKIVKECALMLGVGIVGALLLFVLQLFHLNLVVPIGVVLMGVLAYCNGANDVSKAIATLVGSGVTQYRAAILYGTICTIAGSSLSAVLAAGLVSTFTKGLIVGSVHLTAQFALAAVIGSIAWVYLATRLAAPVSTTHAITGAVVVTGVVAFGFNNVLWANLGSKIVLPLLASPVIAFALGLILFLPIHMLLPNKNLNWVHWLSSGFASFTRGLNDSPKIVALGSIFFLLGGKLSSVPIWLFIVVALAMGVGSFVGGFKVTETLAEKVTKMDHEEGFAANLATALLVGIASPLGFPVSTTHVSSCAIIGIGVRKGLNQVRWKTIWEMVLAWIITIPVAGLLGVIAIFLLRFSLP